jgi:hypothetical protein
MDILNPSERNDDFFTKEKPDLHSNAGFLQFVFQRLIPDPQGRQNNHYCGQTQQTGQHVVGQ